MTHLILTSYTFFSFPSGLRQHRCFKNARLFWDCQLKIRLTRRFWCCFWASVGSWTLWVWVAHRRFLKPAALSCSAAAPRAAALVASATASKTWGWRRSSSSRRGAPNFDPQIIETHKNVRLNFSVASAAMASKMWGWQQSSSSLRGALKCVP